MQERQETQVRSLGQEDPLEKETAIHSSILAWRIPMGRGAWRATVHGVSKSGTRLREHTTAEALGLEARALVFGLLCSCLCLIVLTVENWLLDYW